MMADRIESDSLYGEGFFGGIIGKELEFLRSFENIEDGLNALALYSGLAYDSRQDNWLYANGELFYDGNADLFDAYTGELLKEGYKYADGSISESISLAMFMGHESEYEEGTAEWEADMREWGKAKMVEKGLQYSSNSKYNYQIVDPQAYTDSNIKLEASDLLNIDVYYNQLEEYYGLVNSELMDREYSLDENGEITTEGNDFISFERWRANGFITGLRDESNEMNPFRLVINGEVYSEDYITTDGFGYLPIREGSRFNNPHKGVDHTDMTADSEIYALLDNGFIKKYSNNENDSSGLGIFTRVEYPVIYNFMGSEYTDNIAILDGHMSEIIDNFAQNNAQVNIGDLLGYVGSTGKSTNNHDHKGLWAAEKNIRSSFLDKATNNSTYFNFNEHRWYYDMDSFLDWAYNRNWD
jgi:murein DD-endopeptidase MepM/ murein hydrolase activator NlpD